jgi:hypothetical protein
MENEGMKQQMKPTSIALLSSAGALALLLAVSAPLTVTPAQANSCAEDSDCDQGSEGETPAISPSGEDASGFSGEGKDSSGGGSGGEDGGGGSEVEG